jgi:hypothetical protein
MANVSTDIYLIFIPVPLLWGSALSTGKKIASTIVLGSGIFVLVCAMLKSIFVILVSHLLFNRACSTGLIHMVTTTRILSTALS